MIVTIVRPNSDRYLDAICRFLHTRGVSGESIDMQAIKDARATYGADPDFPVVRDYAAMSTEGTVISIEGDYVLAALEDGRLIKAPFEICFVKSF